MLQDLYLLESGRLAYFGPISATKMYFSNLGFICPAGVNPADYYLDIVSKPPPSSTGEIDRLTWGEIYLKSNFAKNFAQNLDLVVRNSNNSGNCDYTVPPSELYRLKTLMELIFKYYSREIG